MTGQKYKSLLFLKRIHLYVFMCWMRGKKRGGGEGSEGLPFQGATPF